MKRQFIGTDLDYIRNMTEEEVYLDALSDPDNPPITEEDILSGKLKFSSVVTVPVDGPTLKFFNKSYGAGAKNAMADILRGYAASHQANPNS